MIYTVYIYIYNIFFFENENDNENENNKQAIDILRTKKATIFVNLRPNPPTPKSVRHFLLWMDAFYWISFGLLIHKAYSLPL